MVSRSDILAAKVLIVDDQEAGVRLLEGMLRDAGYTAVMSTTDPRDVCELHRKHRYDLILLDIQMPGMNGFHVMKGLSAIETSGYLPVLALTAEPAYKLHALKAGAKDFISKPFDLEEVLTRIHNMLEIRLLHGEVCNNARTLESLALHDPLTGLANRRLLTERISAALNNARRNKSGMAVIYLDLDGFKLINDTRGHGAGDELLKVVAQRLESVVREEDTVARVGGDEFDETIVAHMKRAYNLMIGERTAEEIKIRIGSAFPLEQELTMEVKGRDLSAGLPKTLSVRSQEIREALKEPLSSILESIRITLERCPPELSSDLVDRGIVMAGGGALLRGIDRLVAEETGLPVHVADDPLSAVAEGTGRVLQELAFLKRVASSRT